MKRHHYLILLAGIAALLLASTSSVVQTSAQNRACLLQIPQAKAGEIAQALAWANGWTPTIPNPNHDPRNPQSPATIPNPVTPATYAREALRTRLKEIWRNHQRYLAAQGAPKDIDLGENQ